MKCGMIVYSLIVGEECKETWGRGSKAELIVRSMCASEKTQELINCLSYLAVKGAVTCLLCFTRQERVITFGFTVMFHN